MKLLIVEDSTLVGERLRAAFADLDSIEIAIAGSVAAGLARFIAWKPELAVLDVELPDGSGVELLRSFKRERPAMGVLMYSNYPVFRRRCEACGADAFFDKSIEFEDLLRRVRSLVGAAS